MVFHPQLCCTMPAPLPVLFMIFFTGVFKPGLEIFILTAPSKVTTQLLPISIPFTAAWASQIVTVILTAFYHQ